MSAFRNNLSTIVAGGIVIGIFVVVVALLSPSQDADGSTLNAIVHDGDGREKVLALGTNTTFTVTTNLGTNVVIVEGGAARIASADCPNQSCVHQKPISKPGEQLICLPHHLWVEVVAGKSSSGAKLDESAVTWDDTHGNANTGSGTGTNNEPGSGANKGSGAEASRENAAGSEAGTSTEPGSGANAGSGGTTSKGSGAEASAEAEAASAESPISRYDSNEIDAISNTAPNSDHAYETSKNVANPDDVDVISR